MIVKVCGMRNADNIHAVANLGVDMLGFIFWPRSRRYVPMTPSGVGLLPDRAEASLASAAGMGRSPRRVGVFVDDTVQNIVTRVYNYHLDYVQLHGDETITMIRNLKATLIPDIQPEIKIIKALPVRDESDLARCGDYEGEVDFFLFDTKTPLAGGSGKHFDWSVLRHYEGHTPFLLSGGIGPGDVARLKAFHHPRMAGIDLNSRFETAPGVKDVVLLRTFLHEMGFVPANNCQ